MTQIEEVSQHAAHESCEAPADYEAAFSENNPSVSLKDTNMGNADLKALFGQFDPSSPIAGEVLNRARSLCAKHIGGAWITASLNNFKLKPVTGGMSNLLYLAELSDNVQMVRSEPRQVVLRVFCQENYDQLVIESVVFTLLSERKLGPKLLGVFPGGRFEEFIPSRALACDELSDARFSRIIAPMIARVHVLDVPITKEPQLISAGREWLRKFRLTTGGQQPIIMKTTGVNVDSSLFPPVLTIDDLEKEWDFVERFVEKCGCPLVFSHNDVQKGNVLLKNGFEICDETVLHNGVPTEEDPLVLIDFEYCSYNYRGFDFGNHFCEFGFDYECDSPPYYIVHQDRFNLPNQRKIICSKYIDEIYEIAESDKEKDYSYFVSGDRDADVQKLLKESYLFMPISHLFWVFWALLNAESSVLAFDYGSYGRDRLALYYERKPDMEKFLNSL